MANKRNSKVIPNPAIGTAARKRTEQTEAYNFVEFSEVSEYRNVNKELLKTALTFLPDNPASITQVDNATGTGLIPQLAVELYRGLKKHATIIGIDPDLYALKKAAESIQNTDGMQLLFIQGYGQNLRDLLQQHVPQQEIDIVSIHDAIHEIPGRDIKRAIFSAQADILRPGGVQTYNSAFTTIGMGEAVMQYGRWKLDAFSFFKQNRNKNIQAIEVYTPEEYAQMIKDSGLTIVHERRKTVVLSYDALKAISQYPEFVNGVFRDMEHADEYTLLEKSEALIKALDKQGITRLPRQWHEIIAQKPK